MFDAIKRWFTGVENNAAVFTLTEAKTARSEFANVLRSSAEEWNAIEKNLGGLAERIVGASIDELREQTANALEHLHTTKEMLEGEIKRLRDEFNAEYDRLSNELSSTIFAVEGYTKLVVHFDKHNETMTDDELQAAIAEDSRAPDPVIVHTHLNINSGPVDDGEALLQQGQKEAAETAAKILGVETK